MHWTGRIAVAAVMMAGSAQAHAADWWLVAGEPGDDAAIFVDADTIARSADTVTFRMERIPRDGHAIATAEQMRCGTPSAASEEEAVRRFACATQEERMRIALIVSPMTPGDTARLIFALPKKAADKSH